MSVAFRRDSDEEHLEPRFELPIPPGPNLVTARGRDLIEQRVVDLERDMRGMPEGDERTRGLRALRYWRARLATAEVVPPAQGDAVAFGARVRFVRDGRAQTLTIVGHDEAEAGRGELAFTAPLARALMGAAAGDLVDFAGRPDAIEVVAVGADA